jgi:hypothetical protein
MSSSHKEDIKSILKDTKNKIDEELKIFKSLKEYTREELDAMSIKEIEKLLIYNEDGSVIVPISGETSQQDRNIYNAWRRKVYKQIKESAFK